MHHSDYQRSTVLSNICSPFSSSLASLENTSAHLLNSQTDCYNYPNDWITSYGHHAVSPMKQMEGKFKLIEDRYI